MNLRTSKRQDGSDRPRYFFRGRFFPRTHLERKKGSSESCAFDQAWLSLQFCELRPSARCAEQSGLLVWGIRKKQFKNQMSFLAAVMPVVEQAFHRLPGSFARFSSGLFIAKAHNQGGGVAVLELQGALSNIGIDI